jgi:tRNA nucleotidyltransferase/poly(A) polymerase
MAQIFKVGGCVRDKLLGLESKDIDFTFVCEESQTVEQGWTEMKTWMTDRGFEIFLETPDCFTIRAKFPKDHKFTGLVADFVMARKEIGYIEGTRRPVLELGTLADDLLRRDFTLNALAEDEDGDIIDLFNGKGHLGARLLKTPLPAEQTMMDDPLRFLRALRFHITKGFFIHHSIIEAMKQPEIFDKLKLVVSAERIREEVTKMMVHNTPATIRVLTRMERELPGLTELIFDRGLWLKPTFEKK